MPDKLNISPQHWHGVRGLSRLIDALYNDDAPARIVGGAVRDTLKGAEFNDVDIATPLLPELVIEKLTAANIKTIPTGLQHGTITAVSDSATFEVTTLRTDVETDGRHARVQFCDDWREDAMRRDFTINALYADPKTGEVFDYFGGAGDLKSQRVKFIGNAHDRIEEDHLRILRYFRFLARFENADIDHDSLAACKALSKRQMTLARERINDELTKILASENPYPAVKLAFENNIFMPFLPEINSPNIEALSCLIITENAHHIAPNHIRRLAAILPNDPQLVDKIASRLKFSNAMRKSLNIRILSDSMGQKIGPDSIKEYVFLHGYDAALDSLLLYGDSREIDAAIQKIKNWDIPRFTLKGGALIKMGLPAGPIISQVLQSIKDEWIAADFPKNDELDIIIARKIADHL